MSGDNCVLSSDRTPGDDVTSNRETTGRQTESLPASVNEVPSPSSRSATQNPRLMDSVEEHASSCNGNSTCQGTSKCLKTSNSLDTPSLVPRSPDVAGHRSRADSDVSSVTSRFSRASGGNNLEKFFSEMGMEKEVLDPIRQCQAGLSDKDVFESISSLDSHEARSICSTFSRSEKEMSDSESFEQNQQQTSVMERNARIIKWLCNVKKAKTSSRSVPGGASK